MKVALIDYGAGNLTSVRKGLAAVDLSPITPGTPQALADVHGIVVPGVGHFAATASLTDEWREAILRRVEAGVPLLGICLGMQWLFEGSAEASDLSGLGVLSGQCYRLGTARLKTGAPSGDVKIPHVGWNSLALRRDASILDGVADGAQVYFTHSFVAPVTSDTAAVTEHGEPFAAVVQRAHIAGVQFHPEKSGDVGLRILRNFVEMIG